MPAPTTNKTAQFDASDTDHIWKAYQSSTPYHNTVPADGNEVQVWDDEGGADLSFYSAGSHWPLLNLTTPVMTRPSLKFDPVAVATPDMQVRNHSALAITPLSTLISGSAFVVAMAFRIVTSSGDDSTTYYNNPALLTGEFAEIAFGIRNTSGVYSLVFGCRDAGGTFSKITIGSLAAATDYVAVFWRTGGSVFAEVHQASGLAGSGNTACSDVAPLSNSLFIGRNFNQTLYPTCYIGEIVFYNAYVGADKTALVSYLTGKWLAGAPPPSPPTLSTMTPSSAFANASVPVKLVGVAFTGAGLNGTAGAFDTVSGFTFSNLSIVSGGASGTVDIQIAAGQAAAAYSFTFTTSGGSSSGTSNALTFTIASPSGGGGGDTGGNVRFNAGFN